MKLVKIVVGVDFSEPSVSAARWVADHFAPSAELVLASIVDVPGPPSFLRAFSADATAALGRARSAAAARVEEFAASLRPPVGSVVREGRPASGLAELDADMAAIGAHGHRPTSRLGTTADRLVRACDRPVLVVRDPPKTAPRAVLAAVDDSDLTGPVLRWTALLAGRWRARARLLHVLGPRAYVEQVLGGAGSANSAPALDSASRWLAARAADAGLDPDGTAHEVVFGDPAFEIVSRTERGDIGLVVMGSRGAGAVSRALLGSVASLVVRNARCPVLVL